MQDAELKLLKARCALLEDIRLKRSQIDYHITQGARSTRELLQENRKDDIVTLDKTAYDKILNYLLSVERNSLYNYGNNQYLKDYYTAIESKEETLKHL